MNKFVSLPIKVILSLVVSLALVLLGLTWLSINQIEEGFKYEQYKKVQAGKHQYEAHTQLIENQIKVVVELMADASSLEGSENFLPLVEVIEHNLDDLRLYLEIEEIWLFNTQEQLLFPKNIKVVHQEINQLVSATIEKQEPQSVMYCQQRCVDYVTVPVMNKSTDVAVLVLSSNLVNIFFNLKKTLESELAMSLIEVDERGYIINYQTKISTLPSINPFVVKALKNGANLTQIIDSGLQVDIGNESKLINVLPVSLLSDNKYFIVIVEDLAELKNKVTSYRHSMMIASVCVFLLLSLIIYWVTRSSSKRLQTLSHALPLVAEKSFDKFKSSFRHSRSYFPDEIDVLNDAIEAMVSELEVLHTRIEQSTRELSFLALYDPLTELPNRNKFNQTLNDILSQNTSAPVAVMFMDLDDFKRINDIHGHDAGDKLLITVARRLKEKLSTQDFISRFSGDEFVIIIGNYHSDSAVLNLAANLLDMYRDPIHIDSDIYYISASIGIAINRNSDRADLIRQADIAKVEAKLSGGNRSLIYSPHMYERVTRRVELEKEVRVALIENQFFLCLQPQINIQNGSLFGFEALIRWVHPEKGFIPPDEFIPVLENSEQMLELGYWIIRRSFEIVKSLIDYGLKDFHLAINLAADQFRDANLVPLLAKLLKEYQIPAHYFELELTESTLVTDVEDTLSVMNSVKALGFSFAIDDFGTGYSSLSYLKQMPVDILKIDRSFISGITKNETDFQIVMSTIAMGKNLKLEVVAEGVEDLSEVNILKQHGCNYVQGYYFSKPVPERELVDVLNKHVVNGKWQVQ